MADRELRSQGGTARVHLERPDERLNHPDADYAAHIVASRGRGATRYTVSHARNQLQISGLDVPVPNLTPFLWALVVLAVVTASYVVGWPPGAGLTLAAIPAVLGCAQHVAARHHVLVGSPAETDTVLRAAYALWYDPRHPQASEFVDALAEDDPVHLVEVSATILGWHEDRSLPSPGSSVADEVRGAAKALRSVDRADDCEVALDLADKIEGGRLESPVMQEDVRHAAQAITDTVAAMEATRDGQAREHGDAAIAAAYGLLARTQDYLADQDRDTLRALRQYASQWVESELTLDR